MNNNIFRAISKIRYANLNHPCLLLELKEAREILRSELGAIHPNFWYDLSDNTSQFTIKDLYNRMKNYVPMVSNPIKDKEMLRQLFDKAVSESETGIISGATWDEVTTAFESCFSEAYLDTLMVHYLDHETFDDFYEKWLNDTKKKTMH